MDQEQPSRAMLVQQLAALDAQIAQARAQERPAALTQALDLIRAHGLTRKELEPALRKRAFTPRQRKIKTVLKAA